MHYLMSQWYWMLCHCKDKQIKNYHSVIIQLSLSHGYELTTSNYSYPVIHRGTVKHKNRRICGRVWSELWIILLCDQCQTVLNRLLSRYNRILHYSSSIIVRSLVGSMFRRTYLLWNKASWNNNTSFTMKIN